MKLFKVRYKSWANGSTSYHEKLSVGETAAEAIYRVGTIAEDPAMDFTAEEVRSVFGFNIIVEG